MLVQNNQSAGWGEIVGEHQCVSLPDHVTRVGTSINRPVNSVITVIGHIE